jgi:hypothetical protein
MPENTNKHAPSIAKWMPRAKHVRNVRNATNERLLRPEQTCLVLNASMAVDNRDLFRLAVAS